MVKASGVANSISGGSARYNATITKFLQTKNKNSKYNGNANHAKTK
jgi:hypothetical protein